MTAVMIVMIAVGVVAGAMAGSTVTRRHLTEEMIRQEDRALAFAEAADRLAEEAAEAGVWVTKLRGMLSDQTVIVRAALHRAQKRPVPARSVS